MEKTELLYTISSLFIIFVMVFTHEYHIDRGVNASRGYISAIFVGLLVFLCILSGIIFNIGILKNFFNKNTELGKEYELYRVLTVENYKSETKANHLVNAVINARIKELF